MLYKKQSTAEGKYQSSTSFAWEQFTAEYNLVLYGLISSIRMKIVGVFVILAACCLMEVTFAAPSQLRRIEKRHAQDPDPTTSEEEKPSEDSESGTDDEKPEEEGDKADEGEENQEEHGESCDHHHHHHHEDGQGDEGQDDQSQTDVEEPAKSDEWKVIMYDYPKQALI